jgi:hypothetical protein
MHTDLLLDDLLFEVEERPVFALGFAKISEGKAGAGPNRYTPVPGRKAIVRRSDDRVLGVVGRDYRLVTNQEAMEAARLCCRQVFPSTKPEEWQFATAEAPATRSSCAIDLVHNSAALDFDVVEPGDKPEAYGPFIRVTNSYNGRRALGFEIGYMRKVCHNGLVLPDTIIRFHYSHSRRDIGPTIKFRIDSEKIARFQDGFTGMVDTLRARAIGRESFTPIVESVYGIDRPEKPKPADGWAELTDILHHLCDKYATTLGENAYSVFNVVTDLASRPPALPCFRRTRQSLQRAAGAWLPGFTSACRDPGFEFGKYPKGVEKETATTRFPTGKN